MSGTMFMRVEEVAKELDVSIPYAMAETQRQNEIMEDARRRAREAEARLKTAELDAKAVEDLAREFSDDVERVLPEAGTLESARIYREKKAKPLCKKIVDVLRALFKRYLNLRESFNRLSGNYNRLQRQYASLDASIDRLTEENRGLKRVAADYDTLCRGFGADRVEEQVRAIRAQEVEQKRQRRVLRRSHNVGAR